MKIRYIIIFSLLLLVISGCNINDRQEIVVQKITGEHQYKLYTKVKDSKQVAKIRTIMANGDWEKPSTKINPEEEASYFFAFEYKKSRVQGKMVTYYIKVDKSSGTMHAIKDNGATFILSEKDAATLRLLLKL
ncbi:hypothetical protein CN918_28945 [Priestia megaterium]|nr:hypothetical protein CN918_28945 [Priestia megaterium]